MAFFSHLNAKVTELSRQTAQDHGQFGKLHAEVDKTLGKLKLFEGGVNSQVGESVAASQAAMAKADKVDLEMQDLTKKLEGIITDFNRHVGENFSVVEEEFRKLQQHLNAVGMYAAASASGARGSSEASGNTERNLQNLAVIVTNFGQDNQIMKTTVDGLRLAVNGLIEQMGPDGCHCRHVDDLKTELNETSSKLNALNLPAYDGRITALEQALGTLAMQAKTSENLPRVGPGDDGKGRGVAQPFIQRAPGGYR